MIWVASPPFVPITAAPTLTVIVGDHDEFVAAQPTYQIGLVDRRADPVGQHDQHLVTDGMSVQIVDHLEIVDIEEQHDTGPTGAPSCVDGFLEPLEDHRPVRQVGERIMARLVVELFQLTAMSGDVLDLADHAQWRPIVATRNGCGDGHPHRRTVVVQVALLAPVEIGFAGDQIEDEIQVEPSVRRMGQILGRHLQHLLGALADYPAEGWVDPGEPAGLPVGHRDQGHSAARAVEGLAEDFLAGPKSLGEQRVVQRDGGFHGQHLQQTALFLGWTPAVLGHVDRDDPDQIAGRGMQRREQRVQGMPGVLFRPHLDVGYPAQRQVGRGAFVRNESKRAPVVGDAELALVGRGRSAEAEHLLGGLLAPGDGDGLEVPVGPDDADDGNPEADCTHHGVGNGLHGRGQVTLGMY
jgi:hypothetical protein